jgi:hypothetical protein
MLTVPAKKRVCPISKYIYGVLQASNCDFRRVMNTIYSKYVPTAASLKHSQSSASIEDVFIRDSYAIVPKWVSMVLPVE